MSDGYDPKQVSEGFIAVENGSLEYDNLDNKLVNSLNSEGISLVQAPAPEDEESTGLVDSEPSFDKSVVSNGADDCVYGPEVSADLSSADVSSIDLAAVNQKDDHDVGGESNDVKATEDAAKEDMFVDAPDELTVYDGKIVHNREALAAAGSRDASDGNDENMQETLFSDNEMQARRLVDEVESLHAMLGNTIDEKDRMAREHEEERLTFMEEVAKIHQQLRGLTDRQFLVESDGGLVDQLYKAETGGVVEKTQKSNAPWHNLVNECTAFLERAEAERSQSEGTMRELHAILFMKDEEIENLNAKVAELLVSRDVVTSYLDSAQEMWSQSLNESSSANLEHDQNVEVVTDRMLASLGVTLNHGELLNESITGKMYHLEKMTSMLIENYNQLVSESSELRQKELDLVEKLSYLEDENRRVLEQLDKDKEVAEITTVELGKTKMELEQEKNRCVNVREKLTLAVTKGKALVQQRDSLRQTLADKTSELEKCTIELQEKSSALEVAELSKVELIKSDNLIASLQESLMQRGTIVEKFAEILSQTAVPEEFQSVDTTERLRWLVEDRNVLTGVSLEFHKISEVLSSIDLPENVSSSNLDSQVRWLGESFYRTRDELSRVKYEVDQMREAAYNQIDHLSAVLTTEFQEKVYLQKELEELTREYDEMVEREHQVSFERDQIVGMLIEASGSKMDDHGMVYQPPSDIAMLIDSCFQKIYEQGIASSEISRTNAEAFERIQSLLYVRDHELSMYEKILEEEMLERSKVNHLSNKLEVASRELLVLKDENSSVWKDFERSEEKLALLREKLSMAVKKGKGLVQERENLKGVLDEKKTVIEKIRLELQQQESELNDCRSHMCKLSNDVECIPKLEADLVAMKDQRDKLEEYLVERNNMLQRVVESIDRIVLPIDSVFEEPVEKVKWLAGYFSECQLAKTHLEEELGRVKVEANNQARILTEAKTTTKLLEDALSVSEDNASRLAEEKEELKVSKAHIEQQLQKVIKEANSHAEQELVILKEEVSTLACKLAEANKAINSLEFALSASENKVSRLEAERGELEFVKADLEQQLRKAVEEARFESSKLSEVSASIKSLEDALSLARTNISALSGEKEDAQAGRAASEMGLEKLREEITIQTGNLSGAYKTIKSMENELSQEKTNLAMLIEERNDAEIGRTNLEDELKELKEEVVSQADRLTDAEATIRSLEEALFKAESNISVLVGEMNVAEQEILTLSSKLNACKEELVGTRGSSESRFQELFDHLNSLQMLIKDDALLSSLRRSFEKKLKSLKDMDHLIKNTIDVLVDKGSGLQQNLDVAEVESYWAKLLSDDPKKMVSAKMDDAEGDDISSKFLKTVAGLQLRNKTLVDKFEGFSSFVDNFIASLLRELLEIRDQAIVMHNHMESLKQNVKNMDIDKQEQEKTITMLRNDIEMLLSTCSKTTQELQYEFEKKLPELDSIPELVTVSHSLFVQKSGGSEYTADNQERLNGSQYAEMADKLSSSVKNSHALTSQFENISKTSAIIIEDLQKKLLETEKASERALEESKYSLHRISKLESDLKALQISCTDMEHNIEDYQVREGKMKDREAELSSLYNNLLKQREAEDQLLSASQLKMLFDKINGIKIHVAESEVGDQELQNSDPAKKLFYIIDSVPELHHQINLLSHDKEELRLNLRKQVAEIKQMKEVVETNTGDKQEVEKVKRELLEIALGLDNLIQKLRGSNLVGESKSAHAGELLVVLEKVVTSTILESEDFKSEVGELTAKLSGSQKVVDELSTKVKLLEDSIHGRAAPPETVQERSIYEAPSMPSGSEISEVEDVGSVGKNVIPPAPSAAHVRTMRKGSSDHLALNIDLESDRLIAPKDTDEDKGHAFKSLNTTGLIPKQGKLFADRIDGIWVSGGRVLMSRPRARIGVIAYWLLLHIWLLGTLL